MKYNLYEQICSYDNLELAFKNAKKGKSGKLYVIEFENELDSNLKQLQNELISQTYSPKPLQTFILRDPKTRKISKSHFRDRIIHHAICNIIEPIFNKIFIHDNYANRKGKGTFKAIEKFDYFKKKTSQNNTKKCFVLKADVKHYFENVDHNILLDSIRRKIHDDRVISLIKIILGNYNTSKQGRGMPLGNLTSQFFANIYLNELDQFVKHKLKAKYYIRYVDDFVIFHKDSKILLYYKEKINQFLTEKLDLELHPDKSRIKTLEGGIDFLGFRIFYHYKLVRRKNLNKFERNFNQLKKAYAEDLINREKVVEKFEGWLAYVSYGNTYKYRRHIIRQFNQFFTIQKDTEVRNVRKHENFNKKVQQSKIEYSVMKTHQLFKKGFSIKKIATKRNIKEGTVWQHIAILIENNQLNIWKVLPKEKINKVLTHIKTEFDRLKDIKNRIKDQMVTYDEINCVLASVKAKKKEKPVSELIKWYQKVHCYRKCYKNPTQREICKNKFEQFITQNPTPSIKRKDFLTLFNNYMTICILPQQDKVRYVNWQEFKNNIQTIK